MNAPTREPLTAVSIVGWFKKARKPQARWTMPDERHVLGLLSAVEFLCGGADLAHPRPVSLQLERRDTKAIASALATLEAKLPSRISASRRCYESADPPAGDAFQPLHIWLERLLEAVECVAAIYGPPALWGNRRPVSWHSKARMLATYVERALEAAGNRKPSRAKDDGPIASVLADALACIDGDAPTTDAIAKALREKYPQSGSSPPGDFSIQRTKGGLKIRRISPP